jgi:hypothetical protein
MTPNPSAGRKGRTERIHERAADPAEAANRPLEPKSGGLPGTGEVSESPHHVLNTAVGEPDPAADSDPYRPSTPDDEADHASGVGGQGQGAEQ